MQRTRTRNIHATSFLIHPRLRRSRSAANARSTCNCPTPPGGPPSSCLDDLIRCQSIIVKKADRAKAFVDELTAILEKVTSAQVDYTQARFNDLRKTWKEQDKAIAELIRKLVCAVCCWECLLECRLCPQLVDIRTLEDRLNGTGMLTKKVYSLFDLQAWHQRNVANMQARVDRIKLVLAAWEKPSDTLGDALDKNGKLIDDTERSSRPIRPRLCTTCS